MKTRFNKRFENLAPEIWNKIIKITELKSEWKTGLNLNPQLLGRLKKSVLITSTGASTRIEGAKLSDEDIENYIKGLNVKRFSDRDKQEVRGYYELLSIIFENYTNIKFSENTIKHFHKELLRYVEKDQRHMGNYKTLENAVQMFDSRGNILGTIFKTTPPYLTPKEMDELITWTNYSLINQTINPLIIIANFVIEFLNIHPFQDGNGRLSRILTNLLLLQNGFLFMPYISHEKLIEDNKPNYYISLRKSQKTFKSKKEDISSWLNFFFDILLKQSQLAISLLNNENIEKILSPQQLKVWDYLQKNKKKLSPLQISKKTKVPRPTINQIMKKLIKLKRVERIGLGSTTKYRIIK